MTCQVFEAKMEFFGRRSDSSWHKEDEVTAGPCIGEITCKCSHLAINSANVDVPYVVMFHLRLGYHGTCIMLCLLELSLSKQNNAGRNNQGALLYDCIIHCLQFSSKSLLASYVIGNVTHDLLLMCEETFYNGRRLLEITCERYSLNWCKEDSNRKPKCINDCHCRYQELRFTAVSI